MEYKYDMRIAHRDNRDEEYLKKLPNATRITRNIINNVPLVRLTENEKINDEIRQNHMRVLEESLLRRDGHKYDEVGILMELIEPYGHKIVYGEVNETTGISSIDPNEEQFTKYIALHSENQLLFMHNHPNNSQFSYGDIFNFIATEEIKIITAIGNGHGIYSMWKKNGFNKDVALSRIKSINRRSALQDILKADVGLGFRYTNSRKG